MPTPDGRVRLAINLDVLLNPLFDSQSLSSELHGNFTATQPSSWDPSMTIGAPCLIEFANAVSDTCLSWFRQRFALSMIPYLLRCSRLPVGLDMLSSQEAMCGAVFFSRCLPESNVCSLLEAAGFVDANAVVVPMAITKDMTPSTAHWLSESPQGTLSVAMSLVGCRGPQSLPLLFGEEGSVNGWNDCIVIDSEQAMNLWDPVVVERNHIISVPTLRVDGSDQDALVVGVNGVDRSDNRCVSDCLLAVTALISRICETRAGLQWSNAHSGRILSLTRHRLFEGCVFSFFKHGDMTRKGQALRQFLSAEERYTDLLRQTGEQLVVLRAMAVEMPSSSLAVSDVVVEKIAELMDYSFRSARIDGGGGIWPSLAAWATQQLAEERDIPAIIASGGGIIIGGCHANKGTTHILEVFVPSFDEITTSLRPDARDADHIITTVGSKTADTSALLRQFLALLKGWEANRKKFLQFANQIQTSANTVRPEASTSFEELPLLEGFVDSQWVRQCSRYGFLFPPVLSKSILEGQGELKVSSNAGDLRTLTVGAVLDDRERLIIRCIQESWDRSCEDGHATPVGAEGARPAVAPVSAKGVKGAPPREAAAVFDISTVSLFDRRSPVYYQMMIIAALLPPADHPFAASRHLAYVSSSDDNRWWGGAEGPPYLPLALLNTIWKTCGLLQLSSNALSILQSNTNIKYCPSYVTVAIHSSVRLPPAAEKSDQLILGLRRGHGLRFVSDAQLHHTAVDGYGFAAPQCLCDHLSEAAERYQLRQRVLHQEVVDDIHLAWKARATRDRAAAKSYKRLLTAARDEIKSLRSTLASRSSRSETSSSTIGTMTERDLNVTVGAPPEQEQLPNVSPQFHQLPPPHAQTHALPPQQRPPALPPPPAVKTPPYQPPLTRPLAPAYARPVRAGAPQGAPPALPPPPPSYESLEKWGLLERAPNIPPQMQLTHQGTTLSSKRQRSSGSSSDSSSDERNFRRSRSWSSSSSSDAPRRRSPRGSSRDRRSSYRSSKSDRGFGGGGFRPR